MRHLKGWPVLGVTQTPVQTAWLSPCCAFVRPGQWRVRSRMSACLASGLFGGRSIESAHMPVWGRVPDNSRMIAHLKGGDPSEVAPMPVWAAFSGSRRAFVRHLQKGRFPDGHSSNIWGDGARQTGNHAPSALPTSAIWAFARQVPQGCTPEVRLCNMHERRGRSARPCDGLHHARRSREAGGLRRSATSCDLRHWRICCGEAASQQVGCASIP